MNEFMRESNISSNSSNFHNTALSLLSLTSTVLTKILLYILTTCNPDHFHPLLMKFPIPLRKYTINIQFSRGWHT